ncbi:MAG: hypothetical protein UFE80_03575 [Christensenellales bacterium]|jgi:lysine-ketoglutarate reductase/saccharopine dehydrogenase-like protein (TIGR00300 family)|uniref:Arginine dihydrolase ArgZ/ArgE-like C-terminal second subdomain domain-containing protein n=1 Tax=Candidatus Avichristensenella intestinipullorum TaxID=2840693 RepID=A0A9D1CHF7_9FIRM|nr:hypothetical protein [Christensenellales bacterium]HIQ62061.1 hypothetical protein [Candidatus Avichristensenella intestinipullorum]
MSFVLPAYRAPDFSRIDGPDATFVPAPGDRVAPEGYHALSIFPEYFRVGEQWLLCEESRMDCVPVLEPDGHIAAREFRTLRAGERVCVGRTEDGREGIYVHADGFAAAEVRRETFAFRTGRSRETACSHDYDELCALLRHEREHGRIAWVLGPACAFDAGARDAFAALVERGFVHALLAGNALATHDLEAGLFGTALGQGIYSPEGAPNGHYHHLDLLNRVRAAGSIPRFLEETGASDGIVHACVARGVPLVLAGSIRDDGPLPEVYADVYAAQDAMRAQVRQATCVICLATALHAIATGNMTPSFRVREGRVRPVYFYCVDVSEFALGKLRDRGSLSCRTLVANVQDFVRTLERGTR